MQGLAVLAALLLVGYGFSSGGWLGALTAGGWSSAGAACAGSSRNKTVEKKLLKDAATAPLSPPTDPRAAEATLIALDHQWAHALQARDLASLDRIIADDFLMTTAAGEVIDKKRYLKDLASGTRKDFSLETGEFNVRVFGDVAVVAHGGLARGEYRGKDTTGRYRWLHIFVWRAGSWQCVANQVTRVRSP